MGHPRLHLVEVKREAREGIVRESRERSER